MDAAAAADDAPEEAEEAREAEAEAEEDGWRSSDEDGGGST